MGFPGFPRDSQDSQDSHGIPRIPLGFRIPEKPVKIPGVRWESWEYNGNPGSTVGIVYDGTRVPSGSTTRRYCWVLMPYYTKVLLGPHILRFGGTRWSSCPIIWRYSRVLMSHYIEVPLGPHALVYEDTLGCSCPIIWRYP
jgi:hypothetical protein